MTFNSLTAISPIDGRYQLTTRELQAYFSEYGLIKYRVLVEVKYLLALIEEEVGMMAQFPSEKINQVLAIALEFSETDAIWIKEKEKETNHDVKAVEYFVKEKFKQLGLSEFDEFVHFGLTSQDINNTAIPLSLKEGMSTVLLPAFDQVLEQLFVLQNQWKEVSMLAHTHGQPASPTRLGKEIKVFSERLGIQLEILKTIPFAAKFGGATGNFNAHFVAFPSTDWVNFANRFVQQQLGLHRSQTTTQIEHYDQLAAMLDCLKRINNILLDLNRDMWTYISMNYFKQKLKSGEIGSSAMPHKVNPIDFENSEGNIGIANALFEHLSAKLPISRLQRDLSDSTVLRSLGVPIAHTLIALKSTSKGLAKLLLNTEKINQDLEDNWAVVSEAIQTILRREGFQQPYELLKSLTRNNRPIDKEAVHAFIATLDIGEAVKQELWRITPQNYTGISLVNETNETLK
jgi:adenylosuccinate lyase